MTVDPIAVAQLRRMMSTTVELCEHALTHLHCSEQHTRSRSRRQSLSSELSPIISMSGGWPNCQYTNDIASMQELGIEVSIVDPGIV